ncbi:Lipoprotein signal peptidase [Desulfarculales bacterium]
MARLKFLALISLVLVGLDQLTKAVAVHYIAPRGRIPMINGFFDLVLWKNTGASFGLLTGVPGGRWILVAFTSLVLGFCAWIASRHLAANKVMIWGVALICGGALGNLVDRLRMGQVIDFLLVYYRSWYWPAFNLADSAITIGGLLLAIQILRGRS